ncbi:uncharacterized protein METZ01_LOCUS395524, partial [marine metagenome]
ETARPARFFQLEDIFSMVDPDRIENSVLASVEQYSDISFWNGYADYMSLPYVERPKFKMLKSGKKTFALSPIV